MIAYIATFVDKSRIYWNLWKHSNPNVTTYSVVATVRVDSKAERYVVEMLASEVWSCRVILVVETGALVVLYTHGRTVQT